VGALLFILILMTVASVLNHTGFEVLPDRWLRGFVGRHLISAAHHNLHHQRYRCNYGLYFRFWDRLTGTDVLESAYDFLGARTGPSAKPEAFDTSG
jgi:sterol desaturase/sphingolipid hydroxylase (fatty acid hydroxylase superfamily)